MKNLYTPIEIPCRSCGRSGGFNPLLKVVTGYRPGASLQVVDCPDCGLTFLNPQYQFDAYSDYYQNDYYVDDGANSLEETYRVAQSHAAFKPYLKNFAQRLQPGATYLDVGAGTGQWLDFLRDVAPEIPLENIHVLEPSDASTAFIRRRYPTISVQRSMLEDNSYPDGFFDGVLCSALIEHFTDPLESLLRFSRIIKDGGRLMLITPNLDEHSYAKGPQNLFKFPHTFYYTPGTLVSLLEKAGFTVETEDVFYDSGLIWYAFLIVVARKKEPRAIGDVEKFRVKTVRDTANAVSAKAFRQRMKARISAFRREFRVWFIKRKIKKIAPWLARSK